MVEIWVGVAVGALTFTGSIIAWAKLRGTLSGKPLLLPGRHLLNAAIALGIVAAGGAVRERERSGGGAWRGCW